MTSINPNALVKLTENATPREANLRSLEWAVITQIDGRKTVADIAETLSLNAAEVQEIFSRLIKENLVEIVGILENRSYITESSFKDMEYSLLLNVGPVAKVLVDDLLDELNVDRRKFPRDMLPLLIEQLSFEISDPTKRFLFIKEMLKKLEKEA